MTTESKFIYGTWRKDKAREPGFSHELISSDFEHFKDKTTMDELCTWPESGAKTLYHAL